MNTVGLEKAFRKGSSIGASELRGYGTHSGHGCGLGSRVSGLGFQVSGVGFDRREERIAEDVRGRNAQGVGS